MSNTSPGANPHTNTDEALYISVEQLALRWHTTKKAIYNMRSRGQLPLGFRRGRKVLMPRARIEALDAAWLAESGAKEEERAHQMRPSEPAAA